MKKNVLAGILLISLLGLLTGGGVKAFFTDEAPLLSTSAFEFGTVDIAVEKIKGGGKTIVTPKNKSGKVLWRVENTGSKDVLLRAKIIEEIRADQDDNGEESVPDVNMTVRGWSKGEDGYYYLKKPVSKGKSADFDLEFEFASPWSGEYKLYLESQAIQASNNAINAMWPGNPR